MGRRAAALVRHRPAGRPGRTARAAAGQCTIISQIFLGPPPSAAPCPPGRPQPGLASSSPPGCSYHCRPLPTPPAPGLPAASTPAWSPRPRLSTSGTHGTRWPRTPRRWRRWRNSASRCVPRPGWHPPPPAAVLRGRCHIAACWRHSGVFSARGQAMIGYLVMDLVTNIVVGSEQPWAGPKPVRRHPPTLPIKRSEQTREGAY